MSRYIDADKVLDQINKICNRCGKMNENNGAMCGACYFDDAKDMIDDFPTAEVKPIVYGEWEYIHDTFSKRKCKECGYTEVIVDGMADKYCPNCGATMIKESEEEE